MHEHALAAGDGIGVQLELTGAVLEQVLGADRLVRKLAGLAREHEAGAQLERERGAEQKAARLGRDHAVDTERSRVLGQPVDAMRQRPRVGEQRRYVLEADPRPWKVGYVADQRAQIDGVGRHPINGRSCADRGSAAGA